ncbi:MAG: TetR/AcrR family transcriptional regulator [Bacteroidales bacterium]|nr:TetR/AcrR family transcriptional regulator [Bacteroidales bacterium]
MNQKLKDIVSKSCQLFARYGIKSVSMDDIAKGCGISKKTLYEYIKDKRDLVKKVLSEEFADNSSLPHNIDFTNKNAVESLFEVYKNAIAFFKEFNLSMEFDLQKYYPELYEKTKLKRREKLYSKMIQNLEQGRAEGFFREDFNIDIISKLHVLKIESLLKTDIFDKDDYSNAEIFRELFLYHFHAISTPKGMKELEIKLTELE